MSELIKPFNEKSPDLPAPPMGAEGALPPPATQPKSAEDSLPPPATIPKKADGSFLNNLLFAASVAAFSALLLIRFTSVTEAVIAAITLVIGAISYSFPKFRDFNKRPLWQSGLTTFVLTIALCVTVTFLILLPPINGGEQQSVKTTINGGGQQTPTTTMNGGDQRDLNINRLVTYAGFEDTNEGWSELQAVELVSDTVTSKFFDNPPSDPPFPGSINEGLTKDHALIGQTSLRVTTFVHQAGQYKSYLIREGTVTAYGVVIYVLAPNVDGVNIDYIQVCVPPANWLCSPGTKPVPGEWTPIMIDLSQDGGNNSPLYDQKITALGIQWHFTASSPATLDLFFDAAEIFHDGPQSGSAEKQVRQP